MDINLLRKNPFNLDDDGVAWVEKNLKLSHYKRKDRTDFSSPLHDS